MVVLPDMAQGRKSQDGYFFTPVVDVMTTV
jgi:hypothetical protein